MNNLKELRIKKCMSQRMLAKKSDLEVSTIVNLEKNRNHPQFVTMHKLADALGVNVEELKFD